MKTKAVCIPVILLMASSAALALITPVSDDFDNNSNTFPNWMNVGAVSAAIGFDGTSANDYDSNDLIDSSGNPLDGDGIVGNLAGDTEATGDGLLNDGGLRLNTQNATVQDEAIGLTVGGTMEENEQITFSASIYNDNTSYSRSIMEFYNLTDGTLLASGSSELIRGYNHDSYETVDHVVRYTTMASDVGDTLQIRFLEDNDATARDIYVDQFSVTSSNVPPPALIHPRLFFAPEDLVDMQARRLTTHTNEWAQLIAKCDNLQGKAPPVDPRNDGNILAREDSIVALALAQAMDPSLPYHETGTNWFFTVLNWPEWGENIPGVVTNWSWPDYGPNGNLGTGEILKALAVWYDLQYYTLTPAERDDASQKLADYADRFRNSYSRFWTTDNGELTGNHCWTVFSSLAAVLYASDHVSPVQETDWSNLLNGHYNTISNLMTTVMADGVSGEGATYWTYGIDKVLQWFQMRREAGEPAFEDIDWFANTGTYGIYAALPGGTDNFGGNIRFDDANPDYWGNPYNELAHLAAVSGDPAAQWLANKQDHSGSGNMNAYRYLFYDPSVPVADRSAMENWRYFDNYGFFIWRDSWADTAQHVAIRSGQHSHGHSKCDDGQFMINRAGVPYIANLGYAVPRYTQDANVLLVDGTGQYSDGDDWGTVFNGSWPGNSNTWGKILHVLANETYYQNGDFFNVLIDPTKMYTHPDLSSWQREVVALGGRLYLLRDAVSASSSVDFDLLLHAQVTAAGSGNTYDQDTYAASNPWTMRGAGEWEIDARSGSPKMKVQDVSADNWSAAVQETWYYDKYDSTPPTRRGNKLKRSLSGTSGTSLVSFGFDDLMTGWTQSAWTNANAEGLHVVVSGSPVIDVLWPLNGVSVSGSDGWNVTGKMAGRHYGDYFFGREATAVNCNGTSLLSATTPVSFHARTEPLPGGAAPNRITIQAASASSVTVYAPYEPRSVMIDGVDAAFSWSAGQLTLSVPATEESIIDLVDADYLAWRGAHFSEGEIASGLSGLDADADGDGRTNWEEYVEGTDPRNGGDFHKVTLGIGSISFGTATGRLYTAEFSTNLVGGAWVPLVENVPGTGGVLPVADTNGFDKVFYRTKVAVP